MRRYIDLLYVREFEIFEKAYQTKPSSSIGAFHHLIGISLAWEIRIVCGVPSHFVSKKSQEYSTVME